MFWFTLAGHLKIGTVKELKQRMSSVEFSHWKAIHTRIAPLGELRGDWQAAKVCSVIAAAWGSNIPAEDFLLQFQRVEHSPESEVQSARPSRSQTTAEAELIINTFVARHNKKWQQSQP